MGDVSAGRSESVDPLDEGDGRGVSGPGDGAKPERPPRDVSEPRKPTGPPRWGWGASLAMVGAALALLAFVLDLAL
jgi:hypothetical protein